MGCAVARGLPGKETMSASGSLGLESALYVGRVEHRRLRPIAHAFAYRHFMLALELGELERAFAKRWLWSIERPDLVSWRRADYLGDSAVPLDESVRQRVHSELGFRPDGSIFLVTQPRLCGFVFNPVSFYYCRDASARTVAVVAEITNTPWRERHAYVLDARGARGEVRATFAKRFHVSPFFPMEQLYRWSFGELGPRLDVHMQNVEGAEVVFESRLALERQPLSSAALARVLLGFPGFSLRSLAAIYWQALRLKLAGAPFFEHPAARERSRRSTSR